MRKVFRFTVSNIFNFIASWMTAWCATNPNLQGNLAWILLVHHTKITKWSCENRIARNSGGNSRRKAKQTQGKPSVRSLRNDASNCVFSPYGLHTRGVPRASQSAPAVGNPSLPQLRAFPGENNSPSYLYLQPAHPFLCYSFILCSATCLGWGTQTYTSVGNRRLHLLVS